MTYIDEEIERKKNLIEDSLYDMQVRRVHIKEWHQSVVNLIKELKKLEEKKEVEEPTWKKYMEKFKNIQVKEKKQALAKKRQMKKQSGGE